MKRKAKIPIATLYTAKELKTLEQEAQKLGVAVDDLIRARALGQGIPAPQTRILSSTEIAAFRERVHQAILSSTSPEDVARYYFVQPTPGKEKERPHPAKATPEEGLAFLLGEEGGCVSVDEAAALFRHSPALTRSAFMDLIRDREIIAYKNGSSEYLVPRWQFMPKGGLLPGLPDVLKMLRESKEYNQITPFVFFLQANPLTRENTPIEALRRGELDTVKLAAQAD